MMVFDRLLQNVQSNLVFLTSEKIEGSHILDVGYALSKAISDKLSSNTLALIANDKLHSLIEENAIHHDILGTIYAIKNIGILFEPELKIDFKSLCNRYSRDSTLLIEHYGDINNKYLYFLTRDKGKKIELKDLNYTIL